MGTSLTKKVVVIYNHYYGAYYNGIEASQVTEPQDFNLPSSFSSIKAAKQYNSEDEAYKDMIDYPGGGVLKYTFSKHMLEFKTIIIPNQ